MADGAAPIVFHRILSYPSLSYRPRAGGARDGRQRLSYRIQSHPILSYPILPPSSRQCARRPTAPLLSRRIPILAYPTALEQAVRAMADSAFPIVSNPILSYPILTPRPPRGGK